MARYIWEAYNTMFPNPQDEYAMNQSDGRWVAVPDTPVIDQSQLNYNNGANTLVDTGPIQRIVTKKVPKVGTPAFARKSVSNSGSSFKRGAKSPSGVVLPDTPNYEVLEPANATSHTPVDPGGYYDENGNWVNTSEVYSDSLIRPQETPKIVLQPNPSYNVPSRFKEFHNDGWEGFGQQPSTVFKRTPSYNSKEEKTQPAPSQGAQPQPQAQQTETPYYSYNKLKNDYLQMGEIPLVAALMAGLTYPIVNWNYRTPVATPQNAYDSHNLLDPHNR